MILLVSNYEKLISVLIFTISVALIVSGRFERHVVFSISALVLILLGVVPLTKCYELIDFDVIGLIIGVSIISSFIIKSGLAELIAYKVLELSRGSPVKVLILLSLTSGMLSIALENVSVVLLLAPITYRVTSLLRVNPVPYMISIAISSNISGAATLIGDPPSAMIASALNLAFTDFIFMHNRPSMFFFTIIPMIVSILSLTRMCKPLLKWEDRAGKNVTKILTRPSVDKLFVTEVIAFLMLKITLLSFRHELHMPLSIPALLSASGLVLARVHRKRDVIDALREGLDYKLILFLISVFILSGSLVETGFINDVARIITSISRSNELLTVNILIWFSVLASAFLDNIPYFAATIPLVLNIAELSGFSKYLLSWALLIGGTLGGNITYIGAMANVTAVRLLEKWGYNVNFLDFTKIGLPFTLISVILGEALLLIFWM